MSTRAGQTLPPRPRNPPPPDLLNLLAEEMAFYARQGDDDRALKLLRHAVPSFRSVEAGSLNKPSG